MNYRLLLNSMLHEALVQVQRLPKTDVQTAIRLVRVSVLKANAELLKGAMAIVEHELNRTDAAPSAQSPGMQPASSKKSIAIE